MSYQQGNATLVDYSGIQKVIWDLDGVFWSYYAFPENVLYNICVEENAKTAMKVIPSLDYGRATELVLNSYRQHHDCFSGLIDEAGAKGISKEELIKGVFHEYHKRLYSRIKEECPSVFLPCMKTINAFRQLHGKVNHVILTHASEKEWALPYLKDTGIARFFEMVLDFEAIGFQSKGSGPEGIAMALGDTDPLRAVFVEDCREYIRVAKEAYPDLRAVLVHDKNSMKPVPEDMVVIASPLEVLRELCVYKNSGMTVRPEFSLSL